MSKRTIKNIILTIIIVLTLGSMYFTMNYAKNNIKETSPSGPGMNNNMTPPDMPGNNASNDSNNTNDQTTNNMNKDESSSEDRKTPPNKPRGESTNQNETAGNGNTPPEKPDGEDQAPGNRPNDNNSESNDNSNSNNMPSMPNDRPDGMPSMENNSTTKSLTTPYYIVFGIESFILAAAIIYLLMSNFNKKGIRETFTNKDKILIATLSTIILTALSTYTTSLVTTNYFLNNETTKVEDSSNGNTTYSSQTEITKDETITSGTYKSTTKDENALSVSGDVTSTISNVTVTKTGDSDGGDNTSFYGTNSAIIAKDGANLTLKNITVETSATGANGVFSYGGSATTNNSKSDGTTINISDSTITTSKDNSGGIMTTGGGIMNATNLTINTSGTSSAAIRTDRGGGTVTVNKGTYTTLGQGSPTIYSTADVTVKNAKLISKASEGIVIEGKNSVTIEDCELEDTNNKLNGKSTTYKNIFLYQSMSGDAAEGSATFTATNSKIVTNKGDSFYVTNTKAIINLTNNTITNNDSTGKFLRIQKDSWGNNGSNGGNVTLNMKNQQVTGNIVVDSISTLTMNLKNKSTYEGTINADNTAKSISLTLDKTSKIKLTGDSYVTSLDDADESYSNIDFDGYKLYVNGKAIN